MLAHCGKPGWWWPRSSDRCGIYVRHDSDPFTVSRTARDLSRRPVRQNGIRPASIAGFEGSGHAMGRTATPLPALAAGRERDDVMARLQTRLRPRGLRSAPGCASLLWGYTTSGLRNPPWPSHERLPLHPQPQLRRGTPLPSIPLALLNG